MTSSRAGGVLSVLVGAALMLGCGFSLEEPSASYYLLIDKSRSYYCPLGASCERNKVTRANSHTLRAVRNAKDLINALKPNDRFAMAEIQDCSFSEGAALFDETMPPSENELYDRRAPIGAESMLSRRGSSLQGIRISRGPCWALPSPCGLTDRNASF